MIKDIGPDTLGGGISMLHRLGDGLVFSAWTTATGRELWFSDGTEAGTEMITDLNPGPVNGPYVDQMPEVNGFAVLSALADATLIAAEDRWVHHNPRIPFCEENDVLFGRPVGEQRIRFLSEKAAA